VTLRYVTFSVTAGIGWKCKIRSKKVGKGSRDLLFEFWNSRNCCWWQNATKHFL